MQYENLNREVVGDEPDLTDILATSYLVVGHVGRMQDLSMTVEKIAAFSRLRLDLMAVEETLEQPRKKSKTCGWRSNSCVEVRAVDPIPECHPYSGITSGNVLTTSRPLCCSKNRHMHGAVERYMTNLSCFIATFRSSN